MWYLNIHINEKNVIYLFKIASIVYLGDILKEILCILFQVFSWFVFCAGTRVCGWGVNKCLIFKCKRTTLFIVLYKFL